MKEGVCAVAQIGCKFIKSNMVRKVYGERVRVDDKLLGRWML